MATLVFDSPEEATPAPRLVFDDEPQATAPNQPRLVYDDEPRRLAFDTPAESEEAPLRSSNPSRNRFARDQVAQTIQFEGEEQRGRNLAPGEVEAPEEPPKVGFGPGWQRPPDPSRSGMLYGAAATAAGDIAAPFLEATGEMAGTLGLRGLHDRLQSAADYERDVAATLNYTPNMDMEEIKKSLDEGRWLDAGKEIVKGTPGAFGTSVAHMTGLMASFPAYGLSQLERLADERARNKGLYNAGAQEKLEVLPYTIGILALDRVGLNSLLGQVPKNVLENIGIQVLKGFGKGAAIEGSTEGIQSLLETWGTTQGTTAAPSDFDATLQAAVEAVMGGLIGGPLSAGSAATEPGIKIAEDYKGFRQAQIELKITEDRARIRQAIDNGEIPGMFTDADLDPESVPPDLLPLLRDLEAEAVRRMEAEAAPIIPDPNIGAWDIDRDRGWGLPDTTAPSEDYVTLGSALFPDESLANIRPNEVDSLLQDFYSDVNRGNISPSNAFLRAMEGRIQGSMVDSQEKAVKLYRFAVSQMRMFAKMARSPLSGAALPGQFAEDQRAAAVLLGRFNVQATGGRAVHSLDAGVHGVGWDTTTLSGMKNPSEVRYAKVRQNLMALAKRLHAQYLPSKVVLLSADQEMEPSTGGKLAHAGYALSGGETFHEIFMNLEAIESAAKDIGVSFEALATEVFAHEFGHALMQDVWENGTIAERLAMLNEYRQWLKEVPNMTAREFWQGRAGPYMYDYRMGSGTPGAPAIAQFNRAWNLSFQEFLADQAARYFSGIAGNLGGIDAAYAQTLRDTWETLQKAHPEMTKVMPTFATYLDSLKYQSMIDYLENQTLSGANLVNDSGANPVTNTTPAPPSPSPSTVVKKAGKALGLSKETQRDLGDAVAGLANFNFITKWAATLPQIERANWNVPGVRRFVEGVRNWWAESSLWKDRANQTLNFARKLEKNKAALKAFTNFAFEMDYESHVAGRKLKPEEIEKIARKNGLTEEGMQVWTRMRKDLDLVLVKLFEVLKNDARRELAEDPIAAEERVKELDRDLATLRNRDYFPLSRFGRFGVKVVATEPMTYGGRSFKTGQTVYFALRENRRDRNALLQTIKGRYKGKPVTISSPKMDAEPDINYQNMPLHLLNKVLEMSVQEFIALNTDEDGNAPSDEEVAKFREKLSEGMAQAKLDYSPAESFKKHLKERKLTPGFSEDALRSYAAYMSGFSNLYAKLKHSHEMLRGLDQVRKYANSASMVSEKEGNTSADLRDGLRAHYKYLMNPQSEWAGLRSFGAIWYLGFNPKSALVNLTQLPLATQPWLEERYGLVKSTRALAGAIRDLAKAFKRGQGLKDSDTMLALEWGMNAQFLQESLATELGAYADGNTLSRALPQGRLWIRQGMQGAMWMFQNLEKVNRLVTFTAAYRLERDAQLDGRNLNDLDERVREEIKQTARVKAREAVERTQGEYARWARPKVMQGRQSALFLFKLYMQHMVALMVTDPSRMRFLRNAFILGGAMGLPFAENMLDLVKWLWGGYEKATGGQNVYFDPKEKIRSGLTDSAEWMKEIVEDDMPLLAEYLESAPDLLMHGVGRYGLGIFPWGDLSASLSLGTIVPGTENLSRERGPLSDPYGDVGRMVEALGGPLAGIAIGGLKAVASSDMNEWKAWEQAMPIFMRNLSKAARWAVEGEEPGYRGETVLPFDRTDPGHLIEIAGQAAGLTPLRLTEVREENWAMKEAERFYMARRSALMEQFYEETMSPDREARKDAIAAIKKYNKEIPFKEMGISAQDLRNATRRRIVNRERAERQLPDSKKYLRLRRSVQESFPQARFEEEAP